MFKRNTFLALAFFSTVMLTGQSEKLPRIQSHNDYLQNVPFWKAYSSGLHIIEVDVFLKNGFLFVAHTESEIVPGNTLETLYLDPLQYAMTHHIGNMGDLTLMLDIKSASKPTLDKIIDVLDKYPKIKGHRSIKLLISGNRPHPADYSTYPGYIYFDHQELEQDMDADDWKKVAMVSTNFKKYSQWNGKGRLTHDDYDTVMKVVKKGKRLNKPFRFWGAPDSKTAWKAFVEMGVDVINTDMPHACVNYLETLPERTAHPMVRSKIYEPSFQSDASDKPVKNVILMIGDGNGLSQISSAVLTNNGELTLTKLKSLGLSKTQSADDFITDSAAAGTALATGEKTNNRAIGTDVNGKPLKSLTEILGDKNFVNGIITTDWITGATPSAFYAHVKDRDYVSEIAADLPNSKVHFFAGGGRKAFEAVDLGKKFELVSSMDAIGNTDSERVGVFLSEGKLPSVEAGRGNVLAEAVKTGIQFLTQKEKPFFLMVEAAQIDSFGHENDMAEMVSETIDFDRAITEAIKFADDDGETLVIVTADHETSGLAVLNGSSEDGWIEGDFVTHDHTSTLVPVFAYGPRSDTFCGVYENTAIFHMILQCLRIGE